MMMLSYGKLSRIAKDTKPYRRTKKSRDTEDRYPLDWRKHGHKCFFIKQDANGDNEYHIAYSDTHIENLITKEKHEQVLAKGGWSTRDRGNGVYTEWVRRWNVIGIVRKDNTLEFTCESMHQGTRYFLGNMFGICSSEIVSSIKHGGVIYREYEGSYSDGYNYTMVIPLFKGQRINLETNRSVLDYEVHLPYVNRKRSKDMMKAYKQDFDVAEIFFKTMSSEVFSDEIKEVFDEVYPDNKPDWRDNEASKTLHDYAMKQIKTDLYKGLYAVMMYAGSYNAWSIAMGSSYYRVGYEPHQYFTSAKQKFAKMLKLDGDVFDNKVYKANETYPSNSWSSKIMIDGKEVSAY